VNGDDLERLDAPPSQVLSVWTAAYLVTVLALVVMLLYRAGILIVVGSHVLSTWAAAPALLVAGTGARMVLRLCRVPRPSLRRSWRWALLLITECAWLLVPLSAAFEFFGSPSYTVARPAPSAGCRVVVVETSFLFSGGGTVYVAGGWSPFARRIGSYQTDDGARPVRNGQYDVTWDKDEEGSGHLSIYDAYEGGETSFACG